MGTCPLSGVRFLLGGFLQGFPLFPTGVMLLPGFIRQARVRRPRLLPSPGGIDGFPVRHPSGSPAGDGNPKYILSKRQNRPRKNRADGRKDGDGRKCAILARLRKCRMKVGSRISATLCRPPRDAVRTAAFPASAREGKGLQKDNWILHADGLQLEEKSRPKPRFSPLSTLPRNSLRQEICVFAARKKFLSAKKSRFCRTKKPAAAEKCAIRAVPAPVF